jgi:uncharacterized phage protein (TIGR01671 family)
MGPTLKIRIWDVELEKMHYEWIGSKMQIGFFGEIENSQGYIPMLCLDATDKNGKVIYAGDILKFLESEASNYRKEWDHENSGNTPKYALMKWQPDELRFRLNIESRFKVVMEMVEVAGNIFENPELLKV